MATYEFEIYISGDIINFESRYNLFDDGTLNVINGSMMILYYKAGESLGAAIDSALKNIEECGGKSLYIDLNPGTLMLSRGRSHEPLRGK